MTKPRKRTTRKKRETRASPENPTTNLANPDSWLFEAFGAREVASGVRVSEITSLQSTAVFGCVRILAESVASLPLQVYRKRENGKGEDLATDHALYRILHDRPNPEMSSFTFRETLMGHAAAWGNGYAEIETNTAGRVLALWPLLPDRTEPKRRPTGERYFETRVGGKVVPLEADRVLHIRGLGFDGLRGYSPIAMARQAVGLTLAAEEFGARFFGNNAAPAGVMTHPKNLSKDAKARLRSDWQAQHGGLTNAQRVAILEEGMTWTSIGIPQRDAQFLETRKFQTTEIARIFRIPPHMLADLERATFSNIEHQSIEFVVHTLRPWLTRWEQDLDYSLFSDRDRWSATCKFNVEGLLRGDSAQRAAFYGAMFNMGVFSPNDIREKENMNPVEGGDIRLVPLNMVSLENAGKPPEPGPAPAMEPEEDEAMPMRSTVLAVERLLADVSRRTIEREVKQLVRAVKRGKESFDGWLTEFYAGHQDTLQSALCPALHAVALVGGMDQTAAEERAKYHAASVASSWAHQATAELFKASAMTPTETWATSMIEAVHDWAREASQGRVTAVLDPVTTAIAAKPLTLLPGRAA